MRSIINLIRWLYHFVMLFFMMALQIGMLIFGVGVFVLFGCFFLNIDTDWIVPVGTVVFWIGMAVAGILAFLTAGNEDAEQAFLNNVHENHLENERRMEEQNRQMTNWALKDYHRSKGRFWW